MSTEMTLPASFLPQTGAANSAVNDDLGAGILPSFGILGFKGKVWSVRFGGKDTQLMREDGDGPKNSLELVLVKASPLISKIYYQGGYVDGSNEKPDCWSGDGIKPDASVQNKVNATCADCPMNAWGSRISDAGKEGKQCADSRRVAVVPAGDFENELGGGPMLLRVPAASLKPVKAYGDLLKSYGYPYFSAVTKISFDPLEAYPKFVLEALRPLSAEDQARIEKLRNDPRVQAVVNETATSVGMVAAAAGVPASPFTQEQPAPKLSEQAAAKGPNARGVLTQKLAAQKAETARAAATDQAATKAPVTPADNAKANDEGAKLRAQIAALEAQLKGGAAALEANLAQAELDQVPEEDGPEDSGPEDAEIVDEAGDELVSNFDEMLDKLMG